MPSFSQTAFIGASPEKIFSIISDPLQIPNWRKDVPAITEVSGTGSATIFTEDVNFMGRKKLRMKITEFEPPMRLTITAQSGMSILPTQSFTLTPKDSGTHIQLDVDLKVSGLMKLMAPIFPAQFKKIWAAYFKNLDAYIKQ